MTTTTTTTTTSRKKQRKKQKQQKPSGALKKKLKKGPSLLWKLFTEEYRALFEANVLPKMNRVDRKFFFEASRQSRNAIKRAGVVLELFKVDECSSVSSLEYAWKHFRWTDDNQGALRKACQNGNVEIVQFLKEHHFVWSRGSSQAAARNGFLDVLKYCVANGCSIDRHTMAEAAEKGHLECVKFLHQCGCEWDSNVIRAAYLHNQGEVFQYLLKHKCPGWNSRF